MNKKLKLQNNLNNAIKPGNVIGLGESSHGSGTEFQFKVDFMIDTIKSSPNSRFIIFFESYTKACEEINKALHISNTSSEKLQRLMKGLNNVWQCREVLRLFVELNQLIEKNDYNVNFIGVDYPSLEEKKKYTLKEIVSVRDKLMADNLKKSYNPKCISFLWAHNGHIGQYDESAHSEKYYTPKLTTGHYLDKYFENRYIPVAQAFLRGKFSSLLKKDNEYLDCQVFTVLLECHSFQAVDEGRK